MNAYSLLEAMNGIPGETILRTGRLLEQKEERNMQKHRKVWRTALIAAVIVSLFTVTAYAAARFQMEGHRGGESYAVQFGEINASWPSDYVFEFEGPEECPEVHFKTTWAPSEDYWFPEEWAHDWTSLVEGRELHNEELGVYQASCVADIMYAPQFVDGGAMILMGFKPEEITEEVWGEVQVYKFSATATHAIDQEGTVFPTGNFVILFHPEEGWIIGVRGYDSMENIEGIARGIVVEPTGETVHSGDFENPFDFCDIYVG